jgi:hypothetical protein
LSRWVKINTLAGRKNIKKIDLKIFWFSGKYIKKDVKLLYLNGLYNEGL